MAEMTRNPDYLKRHLSVKDRVRNLETGVHPTRSDLNYYDSYGLTSLVFPSSSQWMNSDNGAAWQRRVGIVTLSGRATSKVIGTSLNNDQVAAVLPPEARPLTDLRFQGSLITQPWRTTVIVKESGDVIIQRDEIDSASTVYVYLDGISWLVN
jgi:hypothetical protein